MKIDENIKKMMTDLIDLGNKVLATRRENKTIGGDDFIDSELAYQWATSVQNLLSRVFGRDSDHYINFKKQIDYKSYLRYSPVLQAQGILKAAQSDYEHGHLFEVRRLIEAELFDEFLEQAEHLLLLGYYQPAAVVGGCVLEDGLRKLCHKHNIVISNKSKLDIMNANLAKIGIYSTLIQKKITALADLRNKAAHGKWNEFSKADVEEMIPAIRRFMEDFLA